MNDTLPVDFESLYRVEPLAQEMAQGLAIMADGIDHDWILLAFEYEGGGSTWVSNVDSITTRSSALRAQAARLERTLTGEPEPSVEHERMGAESIVFAVVALEALSGYFETLLPEDWGFAMLLWPRSGKHGHIYKSSADRTNMVTMLRETADRMERGEDRPPGRLGKDH